LDRREVAYAVDPLLGTLSDNGGSTETHALLAGSPAINAGSCTDTAAATVTADQRGVARPQGTACDIGAFELSGAADLAISASAAPAVVNAGQQVTYTITVTNGGPNTATSVTVVNTLPTGAAFVSAGAGCGTASGGTVTCAVGSIADGATAQFTITVTAPWPFGPMSNTAAVSAASPADLDSSNNSVTTAVTVNYPPGVPGLTSGGLALLAALLAGALLVSRRRKMRHTFG
jgi:uncharacterized repeat protein (TIGR01451 family)